MELNKNTQINKREQNAIVRHLGQDVLDNFIALEKATQTNVLSGSSQHEYLFNEIVSFVDYLRSQSIAIMDDIAGCPCCVGGPSEIRHMELVVLMHEWKGVESASKLSADISAAYWDEYRRIQDELNQRIPSRRQKNKNKNKK